VSVQSFCENWLLDMRDVEITHEPIELYKILKFEGMVASGGQAKAVIADGLVLVNGGVETRKRKKIISGDVVEFGEDKLRIKLQ
jgi:ribosome-associated protein